jgi:hypothetical protein
MQATSAWILLAIMCGGLDRAGNGATAPAAANNGTVSRCGDVPSSNNPNGGSRSDSSLVGSRDRLLVQPTADNAVADADHWMTDEHRPSRRRSGGSIAGPSGRKPAATDTKSPDAVPPDIRPQRIAAAIALSGLVATTVVALTLRQCRRARRRRTLRSRKLAPSLATHLISTRQYPSSRSLEASPDQKHQEAETRRAA